MPGYLGNKFVQTEAGPRQRVLDELVNIDENQANTHKAAVDRAVRSVNFPLWAGRLLHFRGAYDGETGAKHFYMDARPGDDEMDEVLAELVGRYQHDNQTSATPQTVARYRFSIARRKQDATYWLGLISYDEKQYATAIDYFRWSNSGPWSGGAVYNLAQLRSERTNRRRSKAL